MHKLKLLKITLVVGACFYLTGAVVHFFGLTLFPFYDAKLYSPYHDSVIALACVFLAMLLITIARDPVKNRDTLKVVVLGAAFAAIFSVAIIWKVDFEALGAAAKKAQTLVEAGLSFVFVFILIFCYPKK